MSVTIELDEKILEEIDEAIEVLQEKREDIFREAFRELAKKKREAEVARQYVEAYGKNPVQSDEFYVDEEQLVEAWKNL
ncbi:MAG: ribbon-helix-helix protein, CopG family [Acidobacteria bacterium]|jgi:metal-responsive CopG/Arc/MetJ family transcriptional regulator|nr:ribbon-helix-helix protein, CopG family [Acidobacteriota bacterium]